MNKTEDIKTEKKPISHGTTLLKWKVPEYVYHEKGSLWKFLALLAVITLVLYGIYTHSYPFSIVVVLIAGVYFLTHKKPKMIEVKVTDMGLVVDHRFYEFSTIQNFWMIYKPGEVENINFRVTKNMLKEITILLGDQDPAELREVLSRYIPEWAGKTESFVDWLVRKLKL